MKIHVNQIHVKLSVLNICIRTTALKFTQTAFTYRKTANQTKKKKEKHINNSKIDHKIKYRKQKSPNQ